MIAPGTVNQRGVVGGTFDTIVTIYQTPTSPYASAGIWSPARTYPVDVVTLGTDSVAYISLSKTTNNNPVTDAGVHWQPLTPLDLTGYEAAFQINPPSASPNANVTSMGGGIVLGGAAGTITIKVPAADLADFAGGEYPYYLQITDTLGDIYFPLIGQMVLVDPI